mmetsp:Transcript_99863/g.277928  ORF Transcript_99863/g.277928 Transcript_99863/m.277928 type:complete len:256 (-) Transcript_99863:144-911(-)
MQQQDLPHPHLARRRRGPRLLRRGLRGRGAGGGDAHGGRRHAALQALRARGPQQRDARRPWPPRLQLRPRGLPHRGVVQRRRHLRQQHSGELPQLRRQAQQRRRPPIAPLRGPGDADAATAGCVRDEAVAQDEGDGCWALRAGQVHEGRGDGGAQVLVLPRAAELAEPLDEPLVEGPRDDVRRCARLPGARPEQRHHGRGSIEVGPIDLQGLGDAVHVGDGHMQHLAGGLGVGRGLAGGRCGAADKRHRHLLPLS